MFPYPKVDPPPKNDFKGTPDYEIIMKAIEEGKNYRHEFNAQFGVQETYPLDKDSVRCGLIGYKVGMT